MQLRCVISISVSTYYKMNEYVLDLLRDDEASSFDSQDLLHLDDMVRLDEPSSFKAIGECMHVCMYVCIYVHAVVTFHPTLDSPSHLELHILRPKDNTISSLNVKQDHTYIHTYIYIHTYTHTVLNTL